MNETNISIKPVNRSFMTPQNENIVYCFFAPDYLKHLMSKHTKTYFLNNWLPKVEKNEQRHQYAASALLAQILKL